MFEKFIKWLSGADLPDPATPQGVEGGMTGALGGSVWWDSGDYPAAKIPACSLPEYRAIVRNLQRPTEDQIRNYIAYVCEAHSWYKKLRAKPPGDPFVFYLDPTAGCDRSLLRGNKVVVEPRVTKEGFRGCHYNWRTTRFYRENFGFLDYACIEARLSRSEGHELARQNPSVLPAFFTEHLVRYVPIEVATAGCVELTGAIHSRFILDDFSTGDMRLEFKRGPQPPARVSDREFRKRMKEHRRKWQGMDLGDDAALATMRDEFQSIMGAERARLQEEMAKAIRRMLVVAYDDSADDSKDGALGPAHNKSGGDRPSPGGTLSP